METEIYETDTMTLTNIKIFEEWFDKHIGTEIEITNYGEDEWAAVCFDLNMLEVIKCRNWENRND